MTVLKDGGSGNVAHVDIEGRLHTHATIEGASEHANDDGRAFNINTGEITLTNAVDTPVMYYKNTGTKDFVVEAIAIGLGPTTGGSGGIPMITIIRNPTLGTIVSNASAVAINSNRNYGSSDTLTSDTYKGATGNTMTDGDDHILIYQAANGRVFATISEVIPPGKSIGIKIKPQASNTSMTIYAAIIGHINGED